MQDLIDLRPLFANPPAAEVLLLARGQLNLAYRRHGLLPPDPLEADAGCTAGEDARDNPAGLGLDGAEEAFGDAFAEWAIGLPTELVGQVMAMLLQSMRHSNAITQEPHAAIPALRAAYEFLLERSSPLGD